MRRRVVSIDGQEIYIIIEASRRYAAATTNPNPKLSFLLSKQCVVRNRVVFMMLVVSYVLYADSGRSADALINYTCPDQRDKLLRVQATCSSRHTG